jgi:hypothetical protein
MRGPGMQVYAGPTPPPPQTSHVSPAEVLSRQWAEGSMAHQFYAELARTQLPALPRLGLATRRANPEPPGELTFERLILKPDAIEFNEITPVNLKGETVSSNRFIPWCHRLCRAVRPTKSSTPSTGITRLQRYYKPLRHLRPPMLALTGSSLSSTHSRRLPLLRIFHLPHVPPSLPRWNHRLRFSLASPATSAFPEVTTGRLPHRLFRGLLDVHSRCSPRGPLIP